MARSLSVAVISDVHLGTYGCHATELLNYLRSINPQILILNGDIIDGWQFSKRYFPQSHFEVINEIFKKVSEGTRVVYITGNHDEILRRYSDMEIGNILLTDKFLLNIDGKKMWIFHGDVFDNTTKGSAKIIAKLGGKGYDLLILLNRAINFCLKLMHKNKVSLSKKVKNGVKKAITYIHNFEQTIADLAIEKKYDYVICGHIHQPLIKNISQEDGSVTYLNSGDWIENLTALEYNNNEWSLYQYTECEFADIPKSKKMYKKYEVNLEMDILQYIHSTKTAI
ncbi:MULTISPECIES: UDP-2,3-diacylglucosamine diphosphatase [Edaphocola]|uniref:UDP-2,3-diacylglucosamine diphosphatase n=1 Tax=Edaphocola TaxID=2601681 RepID=UPI00100A5DC4|nr:MULTISPECIES: UDP-2,3-diacylglucosamine diphosphatase [Edaphocola]